MLIAAVDVAGMIEWIVVEMFIEISLLPGREGIENLQGTGMQHFVATTRSPSQIDTVNPYQGLNILVGRE